MNDITTKDDPNTVMQQVLIKGDLSKLSDQERNDYYFAVCKSLGLNPLTKPFDYIPLNGKLTLYAKRDCADQLRRIQGISIVKTENWWEGELFHVRAYATAVDGREDQDEGAVYISDDVKGDVRANLILKCVTKAKRRVTLSICGLGWLDETEVEDIPESAKRPPPLRSPVDQHTLSSKEQADLICREMRKKPNEPALFNYKENIKKNGWLASLDAADQKRIQSCYRACVVLFQEKKEAESAEKANNGVSEGQ